MMLKKLKLTWLMMSPLLHIRNEVMIFATTQMTGKDTVKHISVHWEWHFASGTITIHIRIFEIFIMLKIAIFTKQLDLKFYSGTFHTVFHCIHVPVYSSLIMLLSLDVK